MMLAFNGIKKKEGIVMGAIKFVFVYMLLMMQSIYAMELVRCDNWFTDDEVVAFFHEDKALLLKALSSAEDKQSTGLRSEIDCAELLFLACSLHEYVFDYDNEVIVKKVNEGLFGIDKRIEKLINDGCWCPPEKACDAFVWAVKSNFIDVVMAFLSRMDAGVLNDRDCLAQTPLYIALERGYLEIAEKLIRSPKVDVFLGDIFEKTPRQLALERGYAKIVELIDTRGNAIMALAGKIGEGAALELG